MAMKIETSEYVSLQAWLSHMGPKLFSSELLTPDTHPIAVLDRLAVKSPANARSGLGMAIGDVVELTSDWSDSDVTKCNLELLCRRNAY